MSSIACSGNWVVDCIRSIGKLPSQSTLEFIGSKTISHGGGAYNVAMALRKLSKQIPILAIGCVGNDKKGKIIKQECKLNNLDIKNLLTLPNCKTSHTLVFIDNKKTRTMFHHQGANKKFNIEQVSISELINKKVKYFYLGHMLLLHGLEEEDKNYGIKAARLLKNITEHHIDTILDMTTIDRNDIKKIINPCLKYTNHFIINELEATALTGIEIRSKNNTINKNNILRSAKYLLNAGVKSTVVIHMKEGALCLQAKNHNYIWHDAFDIPKLSIKSVCGAGDAFCAGFIMGLYHKYSLEKTLQLAITVSNLAIQSEHNTNGILPLNNTMFFANKFCKTKKHFTKFNENFFNKIPIVN
jgi:sugar/nucleoside kinase (ribokinase family)